jgi:UDP-N-acetylmuramate: L-alanyl-gamma-D-glutamyl-meso-diaminopimelate ligase
MKMGRLNQDLPASFASADRVYISSAGLSWDARAVFAPLGWRVRCEEKIEDLVRAIAAEARAGDHVLVMSNSGFGGIHAKLLAALEQG